MWIKSESGEIRLRADAEAARGADFERIVLLARLDGTLLHLGDVARIWDGFAEGAKAARWNERPAILLEVYKQGDKNVIRTAEAVRDYLERAGADLPEAVQLSIWRDESHWLRNRLEVMYKNAALGLVLILVILMYQTFFHCIFTKLYKYVLRLLNSNFYFLLDLIML